MANWRTTKGGGPLSSAGGDGADEQRLKASVQRAFALGWHVAELRYVPGDPPEQTQDPLPVVRELTVAEHAGLLIQQMLADVSWLDVKLERDKIPAPDLVDADEIRLAAETVHKPLLVALTVKNPQMGKAYTLGVGLARMVLEAYEKVLAAPQAREGAVEAGPEVRKSAGSSREARKEAKQAEQARLDHVKQCVGASFSDERVRDLWSELKDLKSLLPMYAADPVAASMRDWQKWAAGDDVKQGEPGARRQIRTVSSRLQRQGQIWRALLSGERIPTDVLLVANYVDAAIDLVRKETRLVLRTLGRNLGTVVVVLFVSVVLGAVVFVLQTFHASAVTSAAGALAALGLSGAGILAAVKSLIARAEQALWETELTAAIGVAINYVPAVPVDSDVENLRNDDPRARGPATAMPAESGARGGIWRVENPFASGTPGPREPTSVPPTRAP